MLEDRNASRCLPLNAGFVLADKPGEYTVKIVPRLSSGKKAEQTEFQVKVDKE